MMNGRKSTSGVALRSASLMWARMKVWFLSAVRRARTMAAASSGTWLSGYDARSGPGSSLMDPLALVAQPPR